MKHLLALALITMAWPAFSNEDSPTLQPIASFNKYVAKNYNDIWGYTAPDGREYALLGVRDGTSIIDITDSPNLHEVAFFPSQDSIWKDIKTYQHYAYIVNEAGGGMQIIDLSGLPNAATLAATYTKFQTSHNINIDVSRGILFAEGDHMEAVRVLSLENPIAPVQISSLGVECHDILAQNNKLFVSEGGHGTIGIWDYTDAAHPKFVSRFGIPNAGYVHNAWPTEDGKYLMTTEETTGKSMKIWDISDLKNVHYVSEYIASNKLAHNTHIKGNFAYISHYGAGLRIVDLTDPRRPQEAAHYAVDTNIPNGYVGAWGAYPFFKSGKVIMSDIETGLYVFQFDAAKGIR